MCPSRSKRCRKRSKPTRQLADAGRTSSDLAAFIFSGTSPSIVPTILIPESFFSAIMLLASSEWPTSSKSSVASLPDTRTRARQNVNAGSGARDAVRLSCQRQSKLQHGPVTSIMTSSPPGCSQRNSVTSYALPPMASQTCTHMAQTAAEPVSRERAESQRDSSKRTALPSATSQARVRQAAAAHLLLLSGVFRHLLPRHGLRHPGSLLDQTARFFSGGAGTAACSAPPSDAIQVEEDSAPVRALMLTTVLS